MAHTLFDRVSRAVEGKGWRLAEVGNNATTLLVSALAGDDVATLALEDAYREAGMDELADDMARRIDINRRSLATYHHSTRRAFFRACAKHGICTTA